MTIVFNALKTNIVVYFVEDTGDEVKKYLILSLLYDTNKVAYNRPKNATMSRSTYEKCETISELSDDLKRKFIKGLFIREEIKYNT